MTRYYCEYVYLGGDRAQSGVALSVEGATIAAVEAGAPRRAGDIELAGLTLPGFANAHSHAFHRVLRGRAEHPGSFWSWRDEMYAVAQVLDPDRYERLARAVFAEMVLAGFTSVGEFHYLHHPPGAGRYADDNEMALALCRAACDAGIRLTLLDVCYLERAPGAAPTGVQERFCDGNVEAWAERTERLAASLRHAEVQGPGVQVGAAAHSLRAVPPAAAGAVARWAADRGVPFHVHVSEQPAENTLVEAAYGASPVALLQGAGALGCLTTVVHATHLRRGDARVLGATGTTVCMCPTTERALGDGIGAAGKLAEMGCPIALGSDSQALIDPFEEARALELDERLRTGRRGTFAAEALLSSATAAGHAALGWPDAGRVAPGARADLVTVSLSSVRLAGASPATLLEHVLFAASPADVTEVVVSGRRVVIGGRHQLVADVALELGAIIEEVAAAAAAHSR